MIEVLLPVLTIKVMAKVLQLMMVVVVVVVHRHYDDDNAS